MKRAIRIVAGSALLITTMALSKAVIADFELTGPDGRRIVLKDNGTWQYLEATDKDRAADKSKQEGELVLFLERRIERDRSCRFAVRLSNNLPYAVRSLVLYYSAYRAGDVLYDTVSSGSGFVSLKPGDSQGREIEFRGLSCQDITRVQVVGGDRCDMGDLHRWSDQSEYKGKCLARVRVAESNVVRFDK